MSEGFPWNERFQRRLLSLYIREPNLVFGVIEPSYFTSPVHSEIAKLVHDLYVEHKRNNIRISQEALSTIVKSALGSKREEVWPGYKKTIRKMYEEEIQDKPVLLTQAVEFAKEQVFRAALVDSERDVNAKNYSRAIKRFDDLKAFGSDADLGVDYWNDLTNANRWFEDRSGVTGSFFLPTLDKYMGGGLGNGELGIVLAGGKVGKSTMLGRFAAGALWQGKNVALATGELSALKYRKRIDAMLTATASWKLTQLGKIEEKDKRLLERLHRVQKRMEMARGMIRGELYIKQWPTGKGRVEDIEVWIDRLEQKMGRKIDMALVDYVRVFRPSRSIDEQRLSIGQVCMDLRGLAIEKNMPVWTAAQSNRAALTKEKIGPEDIAEDISQFWTLDFLLAMCQTKAEYNLKPQRARIMLTAARDVGHGGTIGVLIERDTFRVWEQKSRKVMK